MLFKEEPSSKDKDKLRISSTVIKGLYVQIQGTKKKGYIIHWKEPLPNSEDFQPLVTVSLARGKTEVVPANRIELLLDDVPF